jgi:uncharacterized phage-associated protein
MTQRLEETFQFDRQKFLAAVHHVCARQNPSELGRVKLHKALYFADMLHFLQDGRPLTGVQYIKQQFGPTARHLAWALRELQTRGKLQIKERRFFGFPKTDFISTEPPKSDELSEQEKALLDAVSDFVCAHNAKEISELSHNAAWEMVEFGEVIPYYTAYSLVPTEVTDTDVEWAEQEYQKLRSAN